MTTDRRDNTQLRSHRLTAEQLNALHQFGSLTDEDFEKHKRLLDHEPDIVTFFSRRKAYALVRESMQKGITWFAAIVGGIWLGLDKIKAVFTFLLEMFSQVS